MKQKVARVKGPRKKERKMARKKFHIFVPNLKEIYQFGHKIAFSVNRRLI